MSVPDMRDGAGPPGRGTRRFLRSKRTVVAGLAAVALTLGLTLPLAVAASASPGPIGAASGFEDDDGNLAVDSTFDWNGFAPTTWTGTAPFRTSDKVAANGWHFGGFEDAQATNTDTAFSGGVKQDDNCAAVGTGKAANKDDLKRIYLSSKTVNGHVYLNLAWVRIPQNTTSSSAHVGFEFNQGTTPCGSGSDGLVRRTAGDMLIVYDFEGGGGSPTLTLRRWVTSGACEIGSDSPPCWGTAQNLTASGFAEAKVDTGTTVTDTIGPSGTQTLGDSEFGEAGIDLTAAGVFSPNVCTAFGKALGVSRSSGNSGTAAMKDLVGPGNFTIANCGQVIIRKVTDPSPDPTDTTFHYSTTGGLTPASFDLKNGQKQDYGTTVFAGQYSVTEADPGPNFKLTSLDCSASKTGNGTTITTDVATGKVSFDLKANDVVDCTYTNTLQQGAIKITKTSSKAAATPLAGAKFSITGPNNFSASVTTGSDGTACVDHLTFGTYSVKETAAPNGYEIDDTTAHDVTVSKNSACGDGNEATFSATDTPLTDITATATSEAPGGTQSTITCVNSSNGNVGNSPQGPAESATVTANGLKPGTYTCTIVVDP